MSRGYNATLLWDLSRKSAIAGIFSWNLSARIVCISALRWIEFHQNRKDPIREKSQRFPNLGYNLC